MVDCVTYRCPHCGADGVRERFRFAQFDRRYAEVGQCPDCGEAVECEEVGLIDCDPDDPPW